MQGNFSVLETISPCSICSIELEQAETKLGVAKFLFLFFFVFDFYSLEAPSKLWISFI